MLINGAAARILNCYLETNVLNFSDLCERAGYPTDLGGYYIRQLVKAQCLEKTSRGQYEITAAGRQQLVALALNEGRLIITRPRFVVLAVTTHDGRYVVTRRKRQPFIGFAEWPATTIKMGETAAEACRRVLALRCGVNIENERFIGFWRRIDMIGEDVFDDKLFAVHTCDIPPDLEIAPTSVVADNFFVEADDIWSIKHPAKTLLDVLRFVQSPAPFVERRYELTAEDLAAEQ